MSQRNAQIQKTFATANSFTFAVPTGITIQITGIHAHLATTATVGNRIIEMQFLDVGGAIVWDTRSAWDQAGGSDGFYSGIPGAGFQTDSGRQRATYGLPNPCYLPSGFTVKVFDRANIDPLDTLEVAVHFINAGY